MLNRNSFSPRLPASIGWFLIAGLTVPAIVPAQTRVYPDPPVLVEPANLAIVRFPGVGQPVRFSWQPVEGAARYELNVRVGNFPRLPVVTGETGVSVNLGLTLNDRNALVSWSVRAGTEDGFSTQTSSASFVFSDTGGTPVPGTTPRPPVTPSPTKAPLLPAPQLFAPGDGAEFSFVNGLNLLFDWSDVAGASRYQFTIYLNGEPFIERTPTDSRTGPVRIEEFVQHAYEWAVRAVSAAGVPGLESARRSFVIGRNELPTPTPDGAQAPTFTPTPDVPTPAPILTFTPTAANTPAPPATSTSTPSLEPSPSFTPASTDTPAPTPTIAPTFPPTATNTAAPTATHTPTATNTPAPTPTPTSTPSPEPTFTPTTSPAPTAVPTEPPATPTPAGPTADLNGDGAVNPIDLYLFAALYRTEGNTVSDLDGSGFTGPGDALRLLRLYADGR